MGMSDMGVDPGTGTPYTYSSAAFLGTVDYTSLTSYNASIGATATSLGFQLNLMYSFNLGGTIYVYWVQDVAIVNTTNYMLSYVDNIWNMSSSGASMSASSVTGNGTLGTGSAGSWYYDFASPGLAGNGVTDPPSGSISMQIATGETSTKQPGVIFAYMDPATAGKWVIYDTPYFPFAAGASVYGFVVDGTQLNPIGLPYDAELIAGGPGGGSQTQMTASTTQFSLSYWNGHNWQDPPSAYTFGCETAEGVYNADVIGAHDSNGNLLNMMTTGSSTPGSAYSKSQVATLNFTDPTVSGTTAGYLFINQTKTALAFENGYAVVTLWPGTYTLYEAVGTGSQKNLGTCTIPAAKVTVVSASTGCSGGGTGLSITSFSASVNPMTVGQSTVLSVAVSGGTAPYTYSYTGLPTGCNSVNATSFSCTPTVTGNFTIIVTVTDATHAQSTKSLVLEVKATSGGSLTVALTASVNPVVAGTSTTLTTTVNGGAGTLTYTYSGLPPGCVNSDVSSLVCTPSSTDNGTYVVSVGVTDGAGHSGNGSISLVVKPSGGSTGVPTITQFVASPNPATQGQSLTFVVTTSGSSGSLTFTYTGLPSGCSGSTSPLSCVPTASGTFHITVTATDGAGTSLPAALVLQVNAAGGGGNNNGGGGSNPNANNTILGIPSTTFLILILVIVVVVGVIVVALVSRRSGPVVTVANPPPPAQPPVYPPNYPSYAAQPQPPAPPVGATGAPAFCSRCGSPLEPDFMFCRSCGNQVGK